MSNLVRWNPIRDLLSVNDPLDRFFEDSFVWPRNGGYRAYGPNLDLVENDDNYVVKAELPGFTPDNVDIRIEGNVLTLRGDLNVENEQNEEGQYHVKERRQSSFTRTVQLPAQVNADKAKASFENGILTLTLPKDDQHHRQERQISAPNNVSEM